MTSWPALSSGLPCSWVRVRASPSGGFINAAEHSPSTLRRRLMSLLQVVKALCAESIAWSSSALLQSGTCAKVLPVAGLITPTVFDPATALPFIVIVYWAMGTPFFGGLSRGLAPTISPCLSGAREEKTENPQAAQIYFLVLLTCLSPWTMSAK